MLINGTPEFKLQLEILRHFLCLTPAKDEEVFVLNRCQGKWKLYLQEKVETCKDKILQNGKDGNVGLTLQKYPIEVREMEEGGEDPEYAGDVDENTRQLMIKFWKSLYS